MMLLSFILGVIAGVLICYIYATSAVAFSKSDQMQRIKELEKENEELKDERDRESGLTDRYSPSDEAEASFEEDA